jgi:hypothetical protein
LLTRFPHGKICVRAAGKSIFDFMNPRKTAKTTGISQVLVSALHQNAAGGCEPAALD